MVPAGCRAGPAVAQFNLGFMYDSGQGVPQDYAEAVKWYRHGCRAGHASAQFNLGVMYTEGKGVPQDYAEAASMVSASRRAGLC